jgi:hypothetical protein
MECYGEYYSILWACYGRTMENTIVYYGVYYGDTMEVLWKYYGDTIEQTIDYYGAYYGDTMEVLWDTIVNYRLLWCVLWTYYRLL